MEMDEEPHARDLLLKRLETLRKGERLKVMFDVDDTTADTSRAVLKAMNIDAAFRGKTFYKPEISLDEYISTYHRVWQENPTEIKAQLSFESAKKLSEITNFNFISARAEITKEGLNKWVRHHYRGLKIPVVIVNPEPYSMHGFHKLKQDLHVLVDDSPAVAESMINGYAKGRNLLLVDRWEESVARRNRANTAVVPSAETAARYIIKAVELHAHEEAKDK